jgi:glycosyltransferase involved in cell wall biosynthesis
MKLKMYRIVIIGWKIEKYMERCLSSVLSQDRTDWTACVVIDPSDDRSVEIARSFADKDSRIKVIANETQMFATANIIRSINEQHPEDNDVIITLDADDWFAGRDTLSIVDGYYKRNQELLVTHGSWVSYPDPGANTNNAPYSASDWVKGIRKVDWRASHLRTFKYKVWKQIKDEDLKGPDGLYARVTWDLAIMFPMLEMSGMHRVQFIPERIYVYNQESPYNDGKMRLQEQMQFADYFAAKQPYKYNTNL